MGHALFWLLHLGAVVLGMWALIVTIPLHLIYTAVRPRRATEASVAMRACPECREPIRADARKCKHCGSAVEPQMPTAQELPHAKTESWLVVGTIVACGLMALAFLRF